jgi:uncharacterized protein YecA (UPF0149 family)
MLPDVTFGVLRMISEVGEHSSHADGKFKVGRNDPCPCGSGKKYKRCCGGAMVN